MGMLNRQPTHILELRWGNVNLQRSLSFRDVEQAQKEVQEIVDRYQEYRKEECPENPLRVTWKLFHYFDGSHLGEPVLQSDAQPRKQEKVRERRPRKARQKKKGQRDGLVPALPLSKGNLL